VDNIHHLRKSYAVLRRHYDWAEGSKTLIIDEIHNVGDKERGKAIENLVAWAMAEIKGYNDVSNGTGNREKLQKLLKRK